MLGMPASSSIGDADRPAQPLRAKLGEKDRDEQADRDRDQHGDERGDHGAVDRRQRAEFLGDGIPALRGQEAEAEVLQRRHRADDQRQDDAAQQQQQPGAPQHASDCETCCRSIAGGPEPWLRETGCGARTAVTLHRHINHVAPPGGLHVPLPSDPCEASSAARAAPQAITDFTNGRDRERRRTTAAFPDCRIADQKIGFAGQDP